MKKNVLVAVLLTVFIDLLGIGILIPVVPQLLANPASPAFLLPAGYTLGQGYIMLGFLTAIYPFMQFVATPILGELSDRYGRKPVLAISLLGTAISYALFAIGIITKNIPLLFISRAFDGITGGNIAVAQAAIADISRPEDRAKNFGLIGAAFGMGFILGPFLGGKLSDPHVFHLFSAATPFWFAAALALLNMLSVIFILPETLKEKQKAFVFHIATSLKNIAKAVRIPGLKAIFGSSFLFVAGFTFFTTFFAVFLVERYGFSQGQIGNYFAYVGIWIAIAQALVTRAVSKRFGERTILKVSLLATGIFVFAQILPNVWWPLLLIVPFFAVSNGLSMANMGSLVSRSVGPKVQGEILGINASVQALAQSIPPVLAGYLASSLSYKAPIVVASAIVVAAGVVFIIFVPHKQTLVTEIA